MSRKTFLPVVVVLLSLSWMIDRGFAQQSETDHVIQFFQWKVSQDADDCFNYDRLGTAYIQKARETGDIAYYDLADKALEKSLALESTHPEAAPATKHLATVYFAEHRFAEARALAQRALQLNRDDITPYAVVGDSESEMGNYDQAWLFYRRLEDPASSQSGNDGVLYLQETRASSEAFLTGDSQASIEHMRRAVDISVRAGLAKESIAWSQFTLGDDYFFVGDFADARAAYSAALKTYPGYHHALAGLAKVAAAQGRLSEAIDDYRQAIQVIPLPAYAAALGDVYAKNGQSAEAKKQYDLVEYIGRLNAFNRNVYNRELAVFYADHGIHLNDAVALARKEFEVRHDVYTWDALAWALYRDGQPQQAAEAVGSALRLDTKDAALLFHAGLIYERLGETGKARAFLERAEALNPQFNPLFADWHSKPCIGYQVARLRQLAGGRPMNSHSRFARLLPLVLATMASLAAPQAGYAHPMGNFSISHYASIHIERGSVEVRYFIDMAEIPTYQEIQRTGIVAQEGDQSLAPYLVEEATALSGGLLLEIDGTQLELRAVDESALFTAGAGGLPTMKLGVVYRAPMKNLTPGSGHRVHYSDKNFAGHSGWKEIVITEGDGVSLVSSSMPATDRSAQLSNYPTDLLNSPPQDLEATAGFTLPLGAASQATSKPIPAPVMPSASALAPRRERAVAKASSAVPSTEVNPARQRSVIDLDAATRLPIRMQANRQKTPRSKFTELVSTHNMSFWFLLPAALIAAGLGALHALEPGHGKTIVAAYLVGSRGTPRHAVLLGLIVTAAHTAGVYLLGVITLYASRWIVPEQLYPWLGIISGLMIAGLASYLLLRAWTGEGTDHGHEPGQSHGHWFASLVKPRVAEAVSAALITNKAKAAETRSSSVSLRQLLTLGITGGMVPCPAALVVLLSALSLHRVGLGLFLIVAFSLGLAAVLIVIGLLMVYARQFMARWRGDGLMAKRWLPVASSGFMMILGLGIAVRALLSTGIGAGFLARGHVVSFVGIVLLGLFLGMRHSTDPDHVVAVSTIVSRERSVRDAALIGVLWGVGHTLTISLVGSAIILFGLVIPPRIGLSMELSVAVMLILLGVLNLTGVLRWLTETFTPAGQPALKFTARRGTTEAAGASFDRVIGRFGLYQLLRPLVIGLVHGLAGSAAVALLVLSTIHSPLWAIAYLILFGVGTIAGMMLMTSAIAVPIAYTGNRFTRAGSYLGLASGIVSTAFGMFLIYQIGLVDGLFTGQAHWIPR